MNYRVELSARAERDVEEALAWLYDQGVTLAAQRWYDQLMAALGTLEREPERCPRTAEAAELGVDLRELLFGRRRGTYRILFIVAGRTVSILHIRHSARDVIRPGDL